MNPKKTANGTQTETPNEGAQAIQEAKAKPQADTEAEAKAIEEAKAKADAEAQADKKAELVAKLKDAAAEITQYPIPMLRHFADIKEKEGLLTVSGSEIAVVVTMLGITTKPQQSLPQALTVWANKARRTALAAD